MSKALKKIIDHFNALQLDKVHVPEWNLDIYVAPRTQEAELILLQLINESVATNEVAFQTLIHLALDSEGNELFEMEDMDTLMAGAYARVIERVAIELVNAGSAPMPAPGPDPMPAGKITNISSRMEH